jgi:hypothetical protein
MAPYGDIQWLANDNGGSSSSGHTADRSTSGVREIKYLALPDLEHPYLLARVRWPDIFQAISPMRPDWQDDPGLFDLPYSPSSAPLTYEQAAAIAAEWGALIPSSEGDEMPRRALMRRMPADWSKLSRAERRAWSIDDEQRPGSARVNGAQTEQQDTPSSGGKRRWRWRSKDVGQAADPTPVPGVHDHAGANHNGNGNGNGKPEIGADPIDLRSAVIDLTEAEADVAVTAEDA